MLPGDKRAFDVAVAAVAVVLALPLMVLLAIVSMVLLRTWNPIFVHERIGLGGERFRFLKIRTMPASVQPYQDKHSVDHDDIPAVLRLMRLMHLDELPQLFLVLTGAMSLVGPRPEMPDLHDELDPEFARLRTSVRPGLTGLWQISPACIGNIGDQPEYDVLYVEHRSFGLDLWILWATVGKMLFTRTVTLDEIPGWTADDVAQRAERAQVRHPAPATLVD